MLAKLSEALFVDTLREQWLTDDRFVPLRTSVADADRGTMG